MFSSQVHCQLCLTKNLEWQFPGYKWLQSDMLCVILTILRGEISIRAQLLYSILILLFLVMIFSRFFAVYGEIKAIRATPDKQHKIIEFYDVRSAEAALCALNMSNVRGESIKLEVTKPGGARWSLMQQFPSDAEQKESGDRRMGSPSNSSPSVSNGLFPLENGAMQSLHSTIRGPFSPFMETDLHSCFV